MDVNVMHTRTALREAYDYATESMTHDDAVAHVAETHGVPVEAVHETLATEAA